MYRQLFEYAGNARIILRGDTIADCNWQAVSDLGYSEKESLLGADFSKVSLGGSLSEMCRKNSEGEVSDRWTLKRFDGTPITILAQTSKVDQDDSEYFCLQWQPQSRWKKQEKKLFYQEAILRSVINSTPDLIAYKDYINTNGMYFGCNHAFEKFVGKKEEEIIGRTDLELFGKERGETIREEDKQAFITGEDLNYEEWVTYPDGKQVLLHVKKNLLKDGQGTVIGLLSIARDMTQEHLIKVKLEESERKYKALANTDDLTGIPNRRLFFELAKENFLLSQRNQIPLSLMMIDIDYFKAINDAHGHIEGDHVIQHVATEIKKRLRESDIVARYAGDEFVVLLHDADLENTRKVAESLLEQLSHSPYRTEAGVVIPVTISIGVVMHKGERECEKLLVRADEALYHAKRHGRNRVVAL